MLNLFGTHPPCLGQCTQQPGMCVGFPSSRCRVFVYKFESPALSLRLETCLWPELRLPSPESILHMYSNDSIRKPGGQKHMLPRRL